MATTLQLTWRRQRYLVRFTWSLAPCAGAPVAIGTDFATTAEDGRMRDITRFLEPAA